jgi:hypothetical protein
MQTQASPRPKWILQTSRTRWALTQAALSILGLLMVWNEETLRQLMFEPTLR